MNIKALSWNTWTKGDVDAVKHFLQTAEADIVSLQEMRSDRVGDDIVSLMTGLGYGHAVAVSRPSSLLKAAQHVVVFSRFPILQSEVVPLAENSDGRNALRVQVSVSGELLTVYNVHVRHTHLNPSPEQESEIAQLMKHLPSERVIVMGDLNATPDSKTVALVRNKLIDTDAHALPTWSAYVKGCFVCWLRSVNTKSDYIFTTPDFKVVAFKVDSSRASDHLPIMAELELTM